MVWIFLVTATSSAVALRNPTALPLLPMRHCTPRLVPTPRLNIADDDAASTDWDEALASLRKRQAESAAEPAAPAPPPATEPDVTEGSSSSGAFRFDPPSESVDGGGGFRFERSEGDAFGDPNTVSGSRENDEKLRVLTLYGGRALTFITLASLVFYIYVGLSGGITDGFDRFGDDIEDIRVTMQENERLEAEVQARAEAARARAESDRLGFYGY